MDSRDLKKTRHFCDCNGIFFYSFLFFFSSRLSFLYFVFCCFLLFFFLDARPAFPVSRADPIVHRRPMAAGALEISRRRCSFIFIFYFYFHFLSLSLSFLFFSFFSLFFLPSRSSELLLNAMADVASLEKK